MTLYYEGSDGSKIDLMGDGIYAQDPENLTKTKWDYSTISGGVNGLGKIKRFYKDTQEANLTLGIMADNAEEFNRIMYSLHRAFDRDIRRKIPGKLWWNGWYREVFAVETSQSSFEEYFEAVDREVTFISVYPYWVRRITYRYGIDDTTSAGGLDYDHDYDFDYGMDEITEVVQNDCIDAANFEMIFYGPVQNPSLTIGSHVYEVFTTLEAGDYLLINSLTKKILQYDLYGNVTNVFHLRGRDNYIFEKIPEGATPILRNKEHVLDITIYDERGEPEWI